MIILKTARGEFPFQNETAGPKVVQLSYPSGREREVFRTTFDAIAQLQPLKTGVGKSSLINKAFNVTLAVSPISTTQNNNPP